MALPSRLMVTAITLPALALCLPARGQSSIKASGSGELPPGTWVDRDTGHRVWRVSAEPNSGAFYFNVNAFTPDHRQMVYNSPEGIRVLDLGTMTTRMLVSNPPAAGDRGVRGWAGGARALVVGYRTNSVFFTRMDPSTGRRALYKADTNSGQVTRLIDLPGRIGIASVNADETLGAGTYNESDVPGGDPNAPGAFVSRVDSGFAPAGPPAANSSLGGAHVQADDKGAMMERRLASRTPVVLFTIRLVPGPNGERAGEIHPLLHTTDWINHEQFSPTDPGLLLYAHEGMWQKVDRIWLIRTDGTGKTLIHRRTMYMEIAGHEFWGLDGKTVWYDWQYPKGEDFYLASFNLETGRRTAYHMQRNDWSIHFNLTQDLDMFCGDGGDPGQVARARDGEWIELYHPRLITGDAAAINDPAFWQPGAFETEHLVNMAHHNYRAEPNPRFSPDKRYVFFTSNMFGRSYVFAVEVAKSTDLKDAVSTPELAARYNPVMPAPTTTEK